MSRLEVEDTDITFAKEKVETFSIEDCTVAKQTLVNMLKEAAAGHAPIVNAPPAKSAKKGSTKGAARSASAKPKPPKARLIDDDEEEDEEEEAALEDIDSDEDGTC